MANRKKKPVKPNTVKPPAGRLGSARVLVLTVIEEELRAAQAVLGAKRNIKSTHYFVPKLRSTRRYDLVVTQTSERSNMPALEAVSAAIEDFRPRFVILCGIAGGVGRKESFPMK